MIRLITTRVLKPLQVCLSPSVLVFMSALEISCNQKIHQNHDLKKLLLQCLLVALISGKLWQSKMPDSIRKMIWVTPQKNPVQKSYWYRVRRI